MPSYVGHHGRICTNPCAVTNHQRLFRRIALLLDWHVRPGELMVPPSRKDHDVLADQDMAADLRVIYVATSADPYIITESRPLIFQHDAEIE